MTQHFICLYVLYGNAAFIKPKAELLLSYIKIDDKEGRLFFFLFPNMVNKVTRLSDLCTLSTP